MRFFVLGGSLAFAVALFTGCSRRPLPEAGTPVEQLYASRCGSCHRPYDPHSMTAAMWQIQVTAMQAKIAQAGLAPLNATEQEQILAYLSRHAGTE